MVICEVVLGRGSRARDERETRGEEEHESERAREGEHRPGKEEGSRVFSQRIDDYKSYSVSADDTASIKTVSFVYVAKGLHLIHFGFSGFFLRGVLGPRKMYEHGRALELHSPRLHGPRSDEMPKTLRLL